MTTVRLCSTLTFYCASDNIWWAEHSFIFWLFALTKCFFPPLDCCADDLNKSWYRGNKSTELTVLITDKHVWVSSTNYEFTVSFISLTFFIMSYQQRYRHMVTVHINKFIFDKVNFSLMNDISFNIAILLTGFECLWRVEYDKILI